MLTCARPQISFHMMIGSLRLTSIPILSHFLRRLVRRTLLSLLAWPTRIKVPIMDMTSPAVAAALRPRCEGILRVHVLGAHNLREVTALDLSHPYCSVQVSGDPKEQQTQVADHDDNPRWDERFEFIVERHVGTLECTLKNRGILKTHQVLGKVEMPLSLFLGDTLTHCRAPLTVDGENAGYLSLNVEWKPFLEPSAAAGQQNAPSRRQHSNRAFSQGSAHWSEAVLFCKAVQGFNLTPSPLRREKSHYYVETWIGNDHVRTRTVPGPNPVFDTTMYLRVQNANVQQLHVQLQSARAVRDVPVGSLVIPVQDIVRSSGVVLGTWNLRDVRTGDLQLNLAVRFIRSGTVETASLSEADIRHANLEALTAKAIAAAVSKKRSEGGGFPAERQRTRSFKTAEEDAMSDTYLSLVGGLVSSYLSSPQKPPQTSLS